MGATENVLMAAATARGLARIENAARAPEMYRDQFPAAPMEVLPWLRAQETAVLNAFDANDWLYQTWAYERHDISGTPGMAGDMVAALRSIRARTLILHGTGDLLNPEYEPIEAARFMPNVRVVRISPGTIPGPASAGGGFPADGEFRNGAVAGFLSR